MSSAKKGGRERRELFDKHEINVGRVQGNELMLPKGNVSKRHARLLFRDGRFIVTDLKSTNGTYVNGRKIAQATIVREGDKIYVGDFVLRVEQSGAVPGASPSRPAIVATVPSGSSPAIPVGRASSHTSMSSPRATRPSASQVHPSRATEPGDTRYRTSPTSGAGQRRRSRPPCRLPKCPRDSPPPARPVHAPPIPTLVPRSPTPYPTSPLPEQRTVSARALALTALVEKVAESMDLTPLARGAEPDQVLAHRIERVVREKAKALRDEGHFPTASRSTMPSAMPSARSWVWARSSPCSKMTRCKRSASSRTTMPPPSGATTSSRSIPRFPARVRWAAQSFACVVSHRSPWRPAKRSSSGICRAGCCFRRSFPPTSQYGHALVLKKRRRAEIGLDDLVRSGSVSRAMANFLDGCVAARANLLLVGPQDGTAMLLSALATAGHALGGIVALQSVDELWGVEPAPVCIRLPEAVDEAARLVRAGAKLGPERLVINPMNGHLAAAVASAIAEGCEGVLATVIAPSLRHAGGAHGSGHDGGAPGLTAEAAKGWLAGSFELAVEIARLRDGRFRVMRIAELAHERDSLERDIFTFVIERTAAGGAVEGSFHPTGVVPRVAENLAARGGGFESAIFKRDRA